MAEPDHVHEDFVPEEDQKPRSKVGRWCFGCCCLFVLLSCLAFGGFFYATVKMDPAGVEEVMTGIVPGEVPAGYRGLMALDMGFLGFEMAVAAPEGFQQAQGKPPRLLIMALAVPPGANTEQLKQQMLQSSAQMGGIQVRQVERGEPTTLQVRGEPIEFETGTGVAQDGTRVRQLVGLVPRTKGGDQRALIIFLGAEESFDEAAMKGYLQSID